MIKLWLFKQKHESSRKMAVSRIYNRILGLEKNLNEMSEAT